MRSQVSQVAALPAIDDDGDRPLGLAPEFAWLLRE